MKNIFEKKVVYSVDCDDLSDLIKDLYNINPEIEASLELNDDGTYEIEANSDEFDQNEWSKYIIKQKYSTSEIYNLMNKLAFDGEIDNGTYLIKTY